MRRLLTLAAFLLIVSLVPLCAQRGGRSSGGSHGGFGGGHSGFSGGHSAVAGHVSGFGGSHSSSYSGSHVGSGSRYYSPSNHYRGRRIVTYGYGNRCYGCWGYGYPYSGYYNPYWWSDSYSSYDGDAASERAEASEMNAENLDEQQALRAQDQDLYAPPMNRPRDTQSRDERAQNDPATVLVFRDQHQREIQNYAIVGPMLWNFAPQRTEKIPLAALDIPATIKANEDRGVDFRLPRSSEGQ